MVIYRVNPRWSTCSDSHNWLSFRYSFVHLHVIFLLVSSLAFWKFCSSQSSLSEFWSYYSIIDISLIKIGRIYYRNSLTRSLSIWFQMCSFVTLYIFVDMYTNSLLTVSFIRFFITIFIELFLFIYMLFVNMSNLISSIMYVHHLVFACFIFLNALVTLILLCMYTI